MTTPIFNPNVPQKKSDSLATSQPQILDNFISMYNAFSKNHVPLDAGALAGNHTIIDLSRQQTSAQTDLSEVSVYTKDVEGQTDQVFIRYQNNGQEFQYTAYQIYSTTSTNQTVFFTFLPGKIICYFGVFTTLVDDKLYLYPPVAKKIISVSTVPQKRNFSPTLPFPDFQDYKPYVLLETPINDFYPTITLKGAFTLGQPAPPCNFIIMANL